jgi:hypothetical protein
MQLCAEDIEAVNCDKGIMPVRSIGVDEPALAAEFHVLA